MIPDIITTAKGLGAGYVPIGAVITHEKIHAAFEGAGTSFVHGESFTGHTAISAAGLATLEYIEKHDLVSRVDELGDYLGERMATLKDHIMVGEIRGRGLIRGLELIADKSTKQPFPRAKGIAEAVSEECNKRGLLILPGVAGADGTDGDTLVLAPPYVVMREQIDDIVTTLEEALDAISSKIQNG